VFDDYAEYLISIPEKQINDSKLKIIEYVQQIFAKKNVALSSN
jgi:hypothetical protein